MIPLGMAMLFVWCCVSAGIARRRDRFGNLGCAGADEWERRRLTTLRFQYQYSWPMWFISLVARVERMVVFRG